MATKEAEVSSNEHPTYQQTDGTSGHELGRQISVTLTPQQFEGEFLMNDQHELDENETQIADHPVLCSHFARSLYHDVSRLHFRALLAAQHQVFSPTSCCLMGWRGASANSLLALIGAYYFMGGMALYVAGILEFIIGNTFPALVFTSFGTFWLTLGSFLDPRFAVQSTLLTGQGGNAATYYVPFGYYLVFWAVYTFFLTFAAFRTNVVLVWILLFVALAFSTLGAAYLKFGDGAMATGANLVIAAGACGFTACMGGFYILLHLCLAATDFPFNIPLFDLAHLWGRKQ